jgi:ankyrin repeat protein
MLRSRAFLLAITNRHRYCMYNSSQRFFLKLIDNRADVNTKDNNGSTALISVCMLPVSEEVEMVKLFLDRGADVNAKSKGDLYPRLLAKPEMAKLLKEYGAVDKPR